MSILTGFRSIVPYFRAVSEIPQVLDGQALYKAFKPNQSGILYHIGKKISNHIPDFRAMSLKLLWREGNAGASERF
jgi:hypothetical protein